MAFGYKNTGTNQVVYTTTPVFAGNPLWEPLNAGSADISVHEADTTNVHGIADMALLETQVGAAAKVDIHAVSADPHGDRAAAAAAIATHAGAADPHGDRSFATTSTTTAVATHAAASDPHGDRAAAAAALAAGLATKVSKGDLVFDIRDFGATTGAADNVAAIQAAVDAAAAAAGRVFIPAGTFKIVPPLVGAAIQLKAGLRGIFGVGSSSVIKVVDAVPTTEYYAILSNYNGTTSVDVGGLTLSDFTVDQNNANNQWATSATQYTIKPRYALYITLATAPVAVRRVSFVDLDNTNTISISGTVRDHTIEGCRFVWGSCPVDHDASVIYVNPAGLANAGSWILNNLFQSPGAGSKSARTAIETHGGCQVVTGNVISGFAKGANITGVSVRGGEGIVFSGNQISEAKWGLELWSLPYSINTTDGIRNVIIRDNVIRLNGVGWQTVYTGSAYANGILRDNSTTSLPYQDVLIDSNIITFNNTGYVGVNGDSIGNGIEWRDTFLDTTDRRVVIRNNRIDSPLASGIRWSAVGDSIEITGNLVRNPGQASIAAGGAMPNGSANGIFVNGAVTNSRVSNNYVLDDQGTPTTNVGVYLFPTLAGSANNEAIGNRVPVANSKKIETVTSSFAAGWLIRMDHETYTAMTGAAVVGSTITDRSNGTVRTQTAAPAGTTWVVASTTAGLVPKDTLVWYAADHGVVADGVTDNRAAINALLALVPDGATVRLPAGTVLIGMSATFGIIVPADRHLTLEGSGRSATTIKVANAVGGYVAVISDGHATAPWSDLSGLTVRDLTIDQNSANNPISDITLGGPFFAGGQGRYAIRVFTGFDVTIDNVRVTNADSVNTFALNGGVTLIKRSHIRNCLFDNIGNGAAHDHSTIYFSGDGLDVAGCEFIGGGMAAATAIETHGPNQTIVNNTVRAYANGANITGVQAANSRNLLVHGNKFLGVAEGVHFWVYDATGLTGEALSECIVSHNVIDIDPDAWVFATPIVRAGIMLNNASTAVARAVKVVDNLITFRSFAQPPAVIDAVSCGILWWRTSTVTEGTEEVDLEFSRNTIKNSLGPGIYFDPNIPVRRLRIEGNTIVNPGLGTSNSAYRCGIRLASVDDAVDDVLVARNLVLDLAGTHILNTAIDSTLWAGAVTNGRMIENQVRCADGTNLAVHKGHTSVAWYVRHAMASYVANTGVWIAGSTVDAMDGSIYTQVAKPSGSTWAGDHPQGRRGQRFKPALWYAGPDIRGAATTGVMTQDTVYYLPYYATETATYDKIGTTITTGVGGATIRLGVYADDGHGSPVSTPIYAADPIDASVADPAGTSDDITLQLTPGLYWLAACAQGGAPTVVWTGTPTPQVGAGSLAHAVLGRTAYTQTGVSGALTTYAAASAVAGGPIVALRVASVP